MPSSNQIPTLSDLYHLREQIEIDNSAPLDNLRSRDHGIGLDCEAKEDIGRLLFWLKKIRGSQAGRSDAVEHYVDDVSIVYTARIFAFVFGISGMFSFLYAGNYSGIEQVKVEYFLLIFVVLQLIFCGLSVWILVRSLAGSPPVVLPVNPARFLVAKILPDKRFFLECKSVTRLLVLRYGQEIGALFTLGAVLALYWIPEEGDLFKFVWGATGDRSVSEFKNIVDFIASPWAMMIDQGVVSVEAINVSRRGETGSTLMKENQSLNREWLYFLMLSMIFYALLPRLALWGLSKYCYGKSIRKSFVDYPGAERILSRMKSPIISTQAKMVEEPYMRNSPATIIDQGLILVDWAGALGTVDGIYFEELRAVSPENISVAGLGSLEDDSAHVKGILRKKPDRLLVIVKAWEPPMADLRDFIADLDGINRCTLCLLPLLNKEVSDACIDTWRTFSRDLAIDVIDVIKLDRNQVTEP
jgi:hypothetical protein